MVMRRKPSTLSPPHIQVCIGEAVVTAEPSLFPTVRGVVETTAKHQVRLIASS
jgi:hypothetical protein